MNLERVAETRRNQHLAPLRVPRCERRRAKIRIAIRLLRHRRRNRRNSLYHQIFVGSHYSLLRSFGLLGLLRARITNRQRERDGQSRSREGRQCNRRYLHRTSSTFSEFYARNSFNIALKKPGEDDTPPGVTASTNGNHRGEVALT